MNRRQTSSSQANYTAKYHPLKKTDHDGYVDLQFQRPQIKVPWKAIFLALILFVFGSGLITLSVMMMVGYLDGGQPQSEWVLLALGCLMFLPGFYHVRIAYYAYCKYPGYSFDDIPDFD